MLMDLPDGGVWYSENRTNIDDITTAIEGPTPNMKAWAVQQMNRVSQLHVRAIGRIIDASGMYLSSGDYAVDVKLRDDVGAIYKRVEEYLETYVSKYFTISLVAADHADLEAYFKAEMDQITADVDKLVAYAIALELSKKDKQ